MNEPTKSPFDLLLDEVRAVVREEILSALSNGRGHPVEREKLLTPEEAAALLGGDPEKQVRWLYRHSKDLPFARRLSRKCLRFNEAGLNRWVAARNK